MICNFCGNPKTEETLIILSSTKKVGICSACVKKASLLTHSTIPDKIINITEEPPKCLA